MKLWKGRTARVLVALVASVLIGMLSVGAVHSRQDVNKVAKMTEKMKTVCVGRFLIDLPEQAEVSLSRAFVDGFDIVTKPETEAEFNAALAAREAEINATPNELGKKNMEAVKAVRGNGFAGKMFIFGRWGTTWMEDETKKHTEAVALNGYLHARGVSYSFKSKNYDPKLSGNLPKLLSQVVSRAPSEIPVEPGFCIDRAMIRDPLNAGQTEAVTLFAGLPGHPDVAIVFSTMAGTKRGPGLLARSAEATARQPFYVRAAFRTLREKKRPINGLPGEELAVKVTETNFTTGFNFDWEMAGREDDVHAPLLTLELQTGINPRAGGSPVQSSLSEAALLELWEKISSSIRLRPAAAPKTTQAGPVVPPLGTFASAGETCPQTGWWQCGEGGNGIGVLGGQRQYLKQGQRMPQALLLPPQTLWQKVRGIQPSYEAGTPTSWKLVDKRTRTRSVAPAQLVQAIVIPRADAMQGAVEGTTSAEPSVAVGSYVKTGVPCPASGWWRCEESHALDGTRWFAQGSLLPAATFQVAAGVFGKSIRGPEVIQRRSMWQLVRYAQAQPPVAAQAPAELSGAGDAGAADAGSSTDGPDSPAASV